MSAAAAAQKLVWKKLSRPEEFPKSFLNTTATGVEFPVPREGILCRSEGTSKRRCRNEWKVHKAVFAESV